MSDENTQIKDLTEMERLIIGSSINFVYNLLNNQIYHIEHHDPALTDMLVNNEKAQEDYILLQNFRDVSYTLTDVFGNTFAKLSDEEKESLAKPGIKLETFFYEVFHAVSCGSNEDEE
jgi:hypothetical protein